METTLYKTDKQRKRSTSGAENKGVQGPGKKKSEVWDYKGQKTEKGNI